MIIFFSVSSCLPFVHICVQISSSYKDTGHIGLGTILRTLFKFKFTSLKPFKYNNILRLLGLRTYTSKLLKRTLYWVLLLRSYTKEVNILLQIIGSYIPFYNMLFLPIIYFEHFSMYKYTYNITFNHYIIFCHIDAS